MKMVRACAAALLSLSLAFTSGYSTSNAAPIEDSWFRSSQSDAYNYPLTPEEDPLAWATETEDVPALIEKLKIPNENLRAMSSPGLIETVLTHPFLLNYLAFSNPQDGIEAVREQINALDVLLQRSDAAHAILALYKSSDLQKIAESDTYPASRLGFVELLLAQPEILDSLGAKGRALAVEAALDRWQQKTDFFEADFYGTSTSALLTMRALVRDNPSFAGSVEDSSGLREFVATGQAGPQLSKSAEVVIENLAAELELSYGPAVAARGATVLADGSTVEPFSITATYVYTPKGSAVLAWIITDELTGQQKTESKNWVLANFPGATILRAASMRYNCHAYAWFSTSRVDRWIDDAALYMSDGSYKLLQTTSYINTIPSVAVPGTKVSYVKGQHSAIVASTTEFASKWGQHGLIRHKPRTSPYTPTTHLKYYKKA